MGWPPEGGRTGLFQPAGDGAGNVGRRGDRVAGNHRVAELAEKIADGAGGNCGTSTVLVRSLAAISFSVSKYWVIRLAA